MIGSAVIALYMGLEIVARMRSGGDSTGIECTDDHARAGCAVDRSTPRQVTRRTVAAGNHGIDRVMPSQTGATSRWPTSCAHTVLDIRPSKMSTVRESDPASCPPTPVLNSAKEGIAHAFDAAKDGCIGRGDCSFGGYFAVSGTRASDGDSATLWTSERERRLAASPRRVRQVLWNRR